MECESCGQFLGNGVLPRVDGNNSMVYVIGPCCRHKNAVYEYGEGDG